MNIYIKREKSVFQMERKRIQALVAGIFLYICLGFQYSWSNYIDFLERDQGWSRTELARCSPYVCCAKRWPAIWAVRCPRRTGPFG